ncbi:DUF2759 domain-containing protein [Bacillus sp. DJP31]|uniref:DUF2759 domain-containing protein n=1 Tax=Bacillus sp. DJP31 TaxID=3409789 RepID=UPI003BB6F789
MGLIIIFALVTLLAVVGAVRSLREKNMMGLGFAAGTVIVFGWFTIMTLIHHGFPTAH